MGNICNKHITQTPLSKTQMRHIVIKDDLLFTIPELSPHLEYSHAIPSPTPSPLHHLTPIITKY